MTVKITAESPRQPEILRLIELSDAYAASLYPAESNHLVDVSTLERPSVLFLVARKEAAAVGCCALVEATDGTAEIKRMFVDPNARGLRIGKLLLEAILERARRRGIGFVRLETGIRQPEAIGLYRAYGFTEIAAFGCYKPDPLSIFMEKRLS
nr:N-acetyltransferase [Rhizobium sp. Q54]